MNKRSILLRFVILILITFFIAGCNKEKAEAIKVAAEKFRIESITALEKIKDLFTKTVAMPFEDDKDKIKRLVKDLEENEINSEALSFIISEKDIGQRSVRKINEEFESLEQNYYQFEGMFRSLPEGSFFAREAVKKAEKYAIRLTVDMINITNTLKKMPVKFTGRRTLIIERIAEAKQIDNQDLRSERLAQISKDILELSRDEDKAKQEAIVQCLKAAETGKLVADLMREYGSLNVGEMLASIRGSMNFIAEISGMNQDVVVLLEKYSAIETAIREDPYWKAVLAEKIIR